MARRGTELEFLGCGSGCYGLCRFSSIALMENNRAQRKMKWVRRYLQNHAFCHSAISVRILSRGVREKGLKC